MIHNNSNNDKTNDNNTRIIVMIINGKLNFRNGVLAETAYTMQ